jgi:hypothetical protein
MPGIADIPGVTVHGTGTQDFDLPVGYVDADGKVHNKIILREMTGVEDDMMGNDDLPIGERVTAILSACCVKLGDVEDKATIKAAIGDTLDAGLPLTEQDRIAAMIYLRRASVGHLYKFERPCPRCGVTAKNQACDLRSLKIHQVADAKKRRVKVKLPRSGKEAIVKVLTAQGSIKMGRLRPTSKDLMSLILLCRLEKLDGERLPDDVSRGLAIIKSLPQKDRNFIRQVYNAMEAQVEDRIDVSCKNAVCLAEWDFGLDVGQSFFLELDEEVDPDTLTWL